jgi:hypothetical protein
MWPKRRSRQPTKDTTPLFFFPRAAAHRDRRRHPGRSRSSTSRRREVTFCVALDVGKEAVRLGSEPVQAGAVLEHYGP